MLQPSKAPAACVWPPCCDVLRHVGFCWLKFENGQIFHATFVDVAWCCSRLARFVQQCCAWACALVRFSARNVLEQGGQTRATCCAQQCCDLLRSNVAIVLAGVCKCWANNVGICCVEMLLSFGRGLRYSLGLSPSFYRLF